MDWVAFGAITNAILVLALVCVTIYYAKQAKKQTDSIKEQITWDRTIRPRLDAYTRLIEVISRRPLDVFDQRIVVAQLGLIQPFSSDRVRARARELFEYAEGSRRNNEGKLPSDIVERINSELIPIITEEIDGISQTSA